jgi:hypothetical protein
LQLDQSAQLVGERNLRIDAMQLIQLDAVKAQQAQALLGLGLEVLGLAVAFPAPGPGRIRPALTAITRSSG